MPYAVNPSDGLSIYSEVEADGPPLVLHHDGGGRLEHWRELGYVGALRDDYTLILFDARGYGLFSAEAWAALGAQDAAIYGLVGLALWDEPGVEADLAACELPLFLIAGTEDSTDDIPARLNAAAPLAPHATTLLLSGFGHRELLAEPALVTTYLRAFRHTCHQG